MAKKVGVYVCSGCGIGGSVHTPKLMDLATAAAAGGPVRTSPAFCLEDAGLITRDIEQEGVDSVVIAACSRASTPTFSDFRRRSSSG